MSSGPLRFELEGRSISFASLDDFAPLKRGASKPGLTDLSTHGTVVPGSLRGGDGE